MCRKHSGIVQPSWREDTRIPNRRVSIGTFMMSRTDALGGISQEVSADSRPTFDYKAVSPPGDHQPRSLLPPILLDLSETDDGGPCIANDMSCQNAHTDIAAGCWLCKMSYSLFCRLRPFYIVPPTNKDRETCLCHLHENGRMIVERMTTFYQLEFRPLKMQSLTQSVRNHNNSVMNAPALHAKTTFKMFLPTAQTQSCGTSGQL